MSRVDEYRAKLEHLDDWTPFLLKHSGLPGPRGNLELAEAVAELASKEQVELLLSNPVEQAPENSPEVFLAFCGITALGRMAARGEHKNIRRLRTYASDSRWRVREAVAIALQYVGDANMPLLLTEMKAWSTGNWYEKRAAAAALAEPRLLTERSAAKQALKILNTITASMASASDPGEESFRILRQSMGYCWSVAVAASPREGIRLMERWLRSSNAHIQWIMHENLKKKRLERMDATWVMSWRTKPEENK